jgi:23S rRNA (pseudouridine1915-N3)-methyltransferase
MGPCHIHAHGLLKQGYFYDAFQDYYKRMQYPPQITQHAIKGSGEGLKVLESQAILKALRPQDGLIVLDEEGRNLSTEEFYGLMRGLYDHHLVPCFAIGGAQGHDPLLKQKARYVLSLGAMTWPHMMVRVMLMEQLYRIQQIHKGHPYHRE